MDIWIYGYMDKWIYGYMDIYMMCVHEGVGGRGAVMYAFIKTDTRQYSTA